MAAPADFQTYKRQNMADQLRSAKTKEDFDFERLIRQALTGNDYLVYSVLADMVDNDEKVWCWPSIQEIQARAGYVDRKTVLKAIFRLETYGLLEVIRAEKNPHKQLPNQYRPVKKRGDGLVQFLEALIKLKKEEWESKEWNKSTTNQVVEKIPVSSGKNPIQVVEKIHSNVTHVFNDTQENEIKPTTDVVGQPSADLPEPEAVEAEETLPEPSSRQEAVNPGPALAPPNEPDQSGAGGDKEHIPRSANTAPKPRKVPDWKSDPRIVVYQRYAKLKGYRAKYGYFPETAQARLILEKIPLEMVDRWERLIKIWLDKRFFIGNVFDLTDVFVNGWKPAGKVRR